MPDETQANHRNDLVRNGLVVIAHIAKEITGETSIFRIQDKASQIIDRASSMKKTFDLLGAKDLLDPKLRLITIRLEQTEAGALGALLFDNCLFCSTLEPDAADPVRHQIPQGIHPIRPFPGFPGSKWKNTIEVLVPHHTGVLYHILNIEKQTDMCVGLGYKPGYLVSGKWNIRAILDSRKAYRRFQKVVVPTIRPGDRAAFLDFYLEANR